jgi:hypothetical protein
MLPMYADLGLNKTAPQDRLDHASVAARCDENSNCDFYDNGRSQLLGNNFLSFEHF